MEELQYFLFGNPEHVKAWFWLPAAIAAVASTAGTLLSNRRAKKQQEKANLYNIEQWNRTNEYNSPQEQIKRYQEAGLNPNLIYGSGQASAGNASPAPEMEKISDSYFQNPLPATEMLGAFTDYEVKKAQSDNLKSQTTRNEQLAILDGLKSATEMTKNARDKFELDRAKNLEQTTYDVAAAQLQKIRADTLYTLNQDERATIEQDKNLRESAMKIAGMRLDQDRVKLLNQSQAFRNKVDELDAQFAETGVRPTDPLYARALLQLIEKFSKHQQNDVPDETGYTTREKFTDWPNYLLDRFVFPRKKQ